MTRRLNIGTTFWIATLLYAAAAVGTFNFGPADYALVAASLIWLFALSYSFIRYTEEINKLYWLGKLLFFNIWHVSAVNGRI